MKTVYIIHGWEGSPREPMHKWIKKELNDMNKVNPKNKINKYMLSNLQQFAVIFNEKKKIKLRASLLICHYDFHKWNLLFNKDRLNGILDFENVGYWPKTDDFLFDTDNFDNNFLFIKEYKKYNKLTKQELKSFISQKLISNCYAFRWAYKGLMKDKAKRMPQLKYMVKRQNKLLEFQKQLNEAPKRSKLRDILNKFMKLHLFNTSSLR